MIMMIRLYDQLMATILNCKLKYYYTFSTQNLVLIIKIKWYLRNSLLLEIGKIIGILLGIQPQKAHWWICLCGIGKGSAAA